MAKTLSSGDQLKLEALRTFLDDGEWDLFIEIVDPDTSPDKRQKALELMEQEARSMVLFVLFRMEIFQYLAACVSNKTLALREVDTRQKHQCYPPAAPGIWLN